MWLSECERNEPKVCEWNYVVKSTGGRKGACGKRYWELEMRLLKLKCMEAHKEVNKRLIYVYIRAEKR